MKKKHQNIPGDNAHTHINVLMYFKYNLKAEIQPIVAYLEQFVFFFLNVFSAFTQYYTLTCLILTTRRLLCAV